VVAVGRASLVAVVALILVSSCGSGTDVIAGSESVASSRAAPRSSPAAGVAPTGRALRPPAAGVYHYDVTLGPDHYIADYRVADTAQPGIQIHTEVASYYGLRWTFAYGTDAIRIRDVIQDPGPRQVGFAFTEQDLVLPAGARVDTRWRMRASHGDDGATLVQDIRVIGHEPVTIGGVTVDAVVCTQRQTMRTSYGRATATVTGWIDAATGLVLRQEGTFGTGPASRHVIRQLVTAAPDASFTSEPSVDVPPSDASVRSGT
jgi:hypothetical protein